MKRGVRFTALIWLMMVIAREVPAAVPVPPPTDVEVICRNLNVQVRWKDSSAEQSSFTVALKGNNRYDEDFSTVERQYDLTRHIWGSEDNYMSTFHVVVTATVGGNRSEPALSQTFTFSNVETAAKTCRLDFPPVELVWKGLDATLSFSNPFHFYSELRKAAKPDTAIFRVTITLNDNENKDFLCRVKEETCKYDIVFPEGKEHCVTLDGILFAGNLVGQILFNKTDRICAVENTRWIVMGVLLAIVTLAVIITVAIIVAKRSSSEALLVLPSATQWPVFRKLPLLYTTVSREDTCIVHATPRNTEPSLSSSCSCQESRASVCTEHESSDQEMADPGGLSDDGTDDEDAECEPVSSGYDHRHCIVDMGNGDMAAAYRM